MTTTKHIFLLILLLFLIKTEAQIPSQKKDIFQFKGKMIGNLDDGADCGYLKFATVVDFQIIEFSDKKIKQKNIGIIVRCPELYGKNFFKDGKIYKLTIETEKNRKLNDNFDYTIQNMRAFEKYKNENIYWAISISKE